MENHYRDKAYQSTVEVRDYLNNVIEAMDQGIDHGPNLMKCLAGLVSRVDAYFIMSHQYRENAKKLDTDQ